MQQQEYVAEVYSKQLAKKMRAPSPSAGPQVQQAMMPQALAAPGGGPPPPPLPEAPFRPGAARRSPRPNTDSFWRWNALPNEYIVPLGKTEAEPQLGGSVPRFGAGARGVLRFPSSVQRIVFRTDNISSENQGVMVEGWACWRVSDPKRAVEKLDFSDGDDPMGQASKILAIECAGIMKGLISVKSVADLLKRREDLIDKLRDKLKPTEERWGLSFDEIGISEVQVLSQDVFENLQRPFRNEAREVASTSDLETEERIAQRTAAQKERVAHIEAESESKLSEMRARQLTQIREVELKEEEKRILAEQTVSTKKLEQESALEALRKKLERDRQLEEREARTALELSDVSSRKDKDLSELAAQKERELGALAARRETEIAELEAKEARERELLRLAAEREQAAVEAERTIQAAQKERELLKVAARREVAKEEAALQSETAAREAEQQQKRAEAWAARRRARLTVEAEGAAHRLEVREKEREIDGRLTDAELRARLVQTLPEIAKSVRIGDVRWYGGDASKGGPAGLIAGALEQVLSVAESHGVDLGGLVRRGGGGAGPTAS